jgi:hypothetical protein
MSVYVLLVVKSVLKRGHSAFDMRMSVDAQLVMKSESPWIDRLAGKTGVRA